MASGCNSKVPPPFDKSMDYDKWVKKLRIWQQYTSLEKAKQGPALFLCLEEDAQDAILELPDTDISSDQGVEKIIECLNGLYLKDKTQKAYEAYEYFEMYKRPEGLGITEFVNEFEKRHNRTKAFGTIMSPDILAYRLLKFANLSEQNEQLAKATISDLTYEKMRIQLKKVFGTTSQPDTLSEHVNVKIENIQLVETDECAENVL